MENMENLKVLWVDDLVEIGKFEQGFKINAYKYGIVLDPFSNWKEAEKELRKNFKSFTAIILDANCIYGKDDNKTDEDFIRNVIVSLVTIFAEKQQFIPWYILSAGTMNDFDKIIEFAHRHRTPYQEEWGNMAYKKTRRSSDELFSNIKKVAKNKNENIVAYRYQDVFKYLGERKYISEHARKIMMDMLCALYFPADNWNFKYEGNPLRKVMEYIFRAANKYGLLPDGVIEDDKVNMFESNRYMSGMVTTHSKLRYGTNDDTIFSKSIGNITLQILNFTNTTSHTPGKEHPYTINEKDYTLTENERELFFSYVLQLCHVIKFFGDFVEKHPDKDENKKKMKSVEESQPPETPIINKGPLIQKNKNGLYIGPLPKRFEEYVGKSAKIGNVNPNTKDDNTEYPYFAGIKIGK